jgi:hypothetical protein
MFSRSQVLGAWLLCAGACSSVDDPPTGPMGQAQALVVVLPDTQFYACAYPDIFQRQAQWILEQHLQLGMSVVLHTGDIVDSDNDAQWQVASESMHRLDGQVPYLVTTGNHDLEPPARGSLFPKYFDPKQLDQLGVDTGSFEADLSDNTYAVVNIVGQPWLALGVEFGPRDAVVHWADGVLTDHADLPAILFTHAYLYSDGERYNRELVVPQPYHPDMYGLTPEQGINDGEDLWRKLVEPHENVRLVLSGHVIPDGTAHASVQRASGSVVHQVLANYQFCDACPCAEVEGGGGYLRLLQFSDSRISVTTYSPHYDLYLHDPDNEFTLELAP